MPSAIEKARALTRSVRKNVKPRVIRASAIGLGGAALVAYVRGRQPDMREIGGQNTQTALGVVGLAAGALTDRKWSLDALLFGVACVAPELEVKMFTAGRDDAAA